MDDVSASQSETIQEEVITHDDAVQDAFEAFGITAPTKEESKEADEEPAAIQEEPTPTKNRVVKFNKEDREIPEEEVDELLQKGLALDKERERKSEYQKALDRAAKLAGYDDHEAFMNDLDKIEQQSQKAKEDEYTALRKQLLDDLEYNGVDRQRAEQFIENHPLMKEARQAVEEKQELEQQRQQDSLRQKTASDWMQLYEAYPDTKETAQLFTEGKNPDWYNGEMQSLIQMGYKPLHAYKLAHMDQIQSQTKRQAEQKLIKEQRLGTRAQVVSDSKSTPEPEVPAELSNAFSLFGLNPKAAKKYVK